MNYQKISKYDTANGPGIREVLWVSGCFHHCKGCQNPETWNPESGMPFTEETENEILFDMGAPWRHGITFSGGDPLASDDSRAVITQLSRKLKEKYPDKTIWCYTGHVWDDVKDLECMQYIDVLVDGPFIEELKNPMLPYCGSSNQRIINVKESLRMGQVSLWWKESTKQTMKNKWSRYYFDKR